MLCDSSSFTTLANPAASSSSIVNNYNDMPTTPTLTITTAGSSSSSNTTALTSSDIANSSSNNLDLFTYYYNKNESKDSNNSNNSTSTPTTPNTPNTIPNNNATIFKIHLDRPELMSLDGHTLKKHRTDAILAMKIVTDSQLNPETYYKLSSFNSKGEYITEKPVHNFEITTENIVKIEGEKNPEKLIHTQIAEEIANSVKKALTLIRQKTYLLKVITSKPLNFCKRIIWVRSK